MIYRKRTSSLLAKPPPLGKPVAATSTRTEHAHAPAIPECPREARREDHPMTRILVLPGDGIGPEVTAATLMGLDAADRRFDLGLRCDHPAIGLAALEKQGPTLPEGVMDLAREVGAPLRGPISHLDYPPRERGGINISSAFRTRLDLSANVRPARTRPG